MYTVFIPKKEIIFTYKVRSMWSYDYNEITLETSKDILACDKNEFTSEEKSIEELDKMIDEGFALFPVNEGTKTRDIKDYIKMGFKIAFLRAGEFKKFKKDYKDFI